VQATRQPSSDAEELLDHFSIEPEVTRGSAWSLGAGQFGMLGNERERRSAKKCPFGSVQSWLNHG
jgi:hypothetical protein